MSDLSDYLEFVYQKKEGYVYVATKDNQLNWDQEYFNWPTQQQAIEDFIRTEAINKDVYIAPALFSKKRALKSGVKGSNVVWVEFDGQREIDFASSDVPHPDLIVRTSGDTHVHCYWRVPYVDSVDVIDNINRRLMYHLEADSSGWDAGQVLRPPTTVNYKYDDKPSVETIYFKPKPIPHNFKDFDGAPEIEQEVVRVNETTLPDAVQLLKDLPLHAKLKKRIISGEVPVGSRSSFIMKIGHDLAEEGCKHVQIVSLLIYVDDRIGKFTDKRRDRIVRISEIASKALLDITIETSLVLYSPLEVLNHTEELDWILQGWVHKQGFCIITGAPSVGKTTFCLQLIYHLTTGNEFIGKEINNEYKVLFISLEMGIIELKYFIGKHNEEFQNNPKWNANFRILDEEASLLDYEELIADYEPNLVLIDSLTELASAELKEEEARAITRWIKKMRRRYSCAFICIHHNTKDSSDKKKKERYGTLLKDIYGSYIFGKDADTVINLESFVDDETIIDLYSLKTRYDKSARLNLKRNNNLLFSILEMETNVNSGTGTITVPGASLNLE